MLLLSLTTIVLAWLAIAVAVAGLCAAAARGDRALRRARRDAQTFPLRSTCRPVRRSTFRSSHSDQLAT
jgi:hypothetical protein